MTKRQRTRRRADLAAIARKASKKLPKPLRTEALMSKFDFVLIEIAERMDNTTRLKGKSRATCPYSVVDGQPGATSKI